MVPPWESSGGALKSKSGMDTRKSGMSYHFPNFPKLARSAANYDAAGVTRGLGVASLFQGAGIGTVEAQFKKPR